MCPALFDHQLTRNMEFLQFLNVDLGLLQWNQFILVTMGNQGWSGLCGYLINGGDLTSNFQQFRLVCDQFEMPLLFVPDTEFKRGSVIGKLTCSK